jgi:hypothetical protein
LLLLSNFSSRMLVYRTFSPFTGFQVSKGGTVRSRHPIAITRNKGWGSNVQSF